MNRGSHVHSRPPRRASSLGVLACAAAAIVALVFAVTSGGGTAHQRVKHGGSARRAERHVARRGARHTGTTLQETMARGDAWIRRTAALGLPIWCAGKRGRDVAFTFDDGPGPDTYRLLKTLRQAHERATFFDIGLKMLNWGGRLPSESKLGAIGDHTYSHPDLTTLPPGEIQFQLQRTKEMIHAQSGEHVDLFRAPYGSSDATVEAIAKRLGLLEIMWTQDSRDSLGDNPAQIVKNVENGLHPGAIILFHDNHEKTIRALTTLLPLLHRRHLQSVSLPELFAVDPPSDGLIRGGFYACWPPDKVPKPVGGD